MTIAELCNGLTTFGQKALLTCGNNAGSWLLLRSSFRSDSNRRNPCGWRSLRLLAFKSRVSNCLSALKACGSINMSRLRAKYSCLRPTSPVKMFSSSLSRWFRSRLSTSTEDAPRNTPWWITEISFFGKSISLSWRCFLNRPSGSSRILFLLSSTRNQT